MIRYHFSTQFTGSDRIAVGASTVFVNVITQMHNSIYWRIGDVPVGIEVTLRVIGAGTDR